MAGDELCFTNDRLGAAIQLCDRLFDSLHTLEVYNHVYHAQKKKL